AATTEVGPVLERELGPEAEVSQVARRLRDNIGKETFYDHLPVITSDTRAVLEGFASLYQRAFDNRKSAYEVALKVLYATPGWAELDTSKQAEIAGRLRQG